MILRLRVRRGAKWLDAHCPGWYNGPGAWRITGKETKSISLDLLDLADGSLCVLGQLGGAYGSTAYSSTCNEAEKNSADFEAAPLGFVTSAPDGIAPFIYRRLTKHWKREIRKRRRAQNKILEDAERATRESANA